MMKSEALESLSLKPIWTVVQLFGALFISTYSCAQEPPFDTTPSHQELDRWTSSSLGLEVRSTKRGLKVTKVHIPDSLTPFRESDIVTKVEKFDVQSNHDTVPNNEGMDLVASVSGRGSKESRFKRLEGSCVPGTKLKATILRGDQTFEIETTAMRPELVDVYQISKVIRGNPAIRKHLDKTSRSEALESLEAALCSAITASESPRHAQEAINEVLDSLDISHTAYVPQLVHRQLTDSNVGDVGLVLRRFPTGDNEFGYFVIDMKPGSSASQGTIRLGDRLMSINGTTIHDSRRLILAGQENRFQVFAIAANVDEEIDFEVQSSPNESYRTTSLVARKSLSLGETTKASVRSIPYAGYQFGFIRFWSLMSLDAASVFRSSIQTDLADCEALIVDLRGRGGRIDVVIQIDKVIQSQKIPIIVIIDELSRSAKEILAARLKRYENVVLVGEKTAGAVTPATFATLSTGNLLMHPASHGDTLLSFTGDQRLEGVGVSPSQAVNFFEPYCNGRDKLAEIALRKALSMLWH